jgi:hypothetical protein
MEKQFAERRKKWDAELANTYFEYLFIYVPDASPTAKWEYNREFKLYGKGINPPLIKEFLESMERGFVDSDKGLLQKG